MADCLADVYSGARWFVAPCDCRFGMASLPAQSVDAIVCDPPYELGFMGRKWDASGIAFNLDVWREALRVLKPGGHLVAFGGTRTYHRMACAIEDAGFDVRDCLAWMYGSGFPKSLDVSKAIDKALGAERPVVGSKLGLPGYHLSGHCGGEAFGHGIGSSTPQTRLAAATVTAPATPEAAAAAGYGTALKPAYEPAILARKPLSGTVASNFMEHGTGALNIDGCRIGTDGPSPAAARRESARRSGNVPMSNKTAAESEAEGRLGRRGDPEVYLAERPSEELGRWPANVLLDEAAAAMLDAQTGELTSGKRVAGEYGGIGFRGWRDVPMPEIAGSSGGPSRFFYTAKASRSERDAGLEDFATLSGGEATDREDGSAGTNSPRAGAGQTGGARNIHPTVKPVDVMRWLVRLVSRPGSLILDPFCGSGSTGIATMLEGDGRRFIGMELDPRHVDIARARIAHVIGGTWQREVTPVAANDDRQIALFGPAR